MKAQIAACACTPFHLAKKGAPATRCLGIGQDIATVLSAL